MSDFGGMPPVPPEVIAALAKENQSPLIIGVVSAFTALAFVCVLLRFYARIKLVGIVGLEDYFIVISMVSHASDCISGGCTYTLLGVLCPHLSMFDTNSTVGQWTTLPGCYGQR